MGRHRQRIRSTRNHLAWMEIEIEWTTTATNNNTTKNLSHQMMKWVHNFSVSQHVFGYFMNTKKTVEHFIDILLRLVSWSSVTSLIKSHGNNQFCLFSHQVRRITDARKRLVFFVLRFGSAEHCALVRLLLGREEYLRVGFNNQVNKQRNI